MMGIEKNRMNYNNSARIQSDTALSEQWQKQNNPNLNMPSSKNTFLSQQKKLRQSKKTSKSSSIRRTQAVESINAVENTEVIEGINDVNNSIEQMSMADMGRFDMKMDLVDFVRPPHINPDYLTKDTLSKTSHSILLHLKMAGASENLMQRAETLLQEEHSIKSVTDAYKNALIFA